MNAAALIGLVGLALITGWAVRNGFIGADADMRRAFRDVAIDSEADRAERGLYARWLL